MLDTTTISLIPHLHHIAQACTVRVQVTHNSGGATARLLARGCARSIRAWVGYAGGQTDGIWRDAVGQTSTALHSGTVRGGWQWEPTGGNPSQIRTITTFG
jgi:hypothetical protein